MSRSQPSPQPALKPEPRSTACLPARGHMLLWVWRSAGGHPPACALLPTFSTTERGRGKDDQVQLCNNQKIQTKTTIKKSLPILLKIIIINKIIIIKINKNKNKKIAQDHSGSNFNVHKSV